MDYFQLVKPDILVETCQSLAHALFGVKIHSRSIGVTVVCNNERGCERPILGCKIVDSPSVGFNSYFSHRHVEVPRVPYDSTRRSCGKFIVKSEFPRLVAPHVDCVPSERSQNPTVNCTLSWSVLRDRSSD